MVEGDASNLLEETHLAFNIRSAQAERALAHFETQPCSHAELLALQP